MHRYYDEEGDPIDLRGFMHKEVCPRCGGTGTHVNPAVDGNGISTDDECWQDDDFREGYLNGMYDVTCYECDGKNVVDVIDYEALAEADSVLYESIVQQDQDRYDMAQTERMERMMGA